MKQTILTMTKNKREIAHYENGQFVVAQKLKQGRKPQMVGVVKRLKGKLDLKDVDYYDAGIDDEPVLVVEV